MYDLILIVALVLLLVFLPEDKASDEQGGA